MSVELSATELKYLIEHGVLPSIKISLEEMGEKCIEENRPFFESLVNNAKFKRCYYDKNGNFFMEK